MLQLWKRVNASVSNCPNALVWFRVTVGTEHRPWQWVIQQQNHRPQHLDRFPHRIRFWRFHILYSNQVVEFSLYNMIYTWKVRCEVLCHLLFADLWSDQYSLSRCGKSAIFDWFLAWFHSNSTSIDPIGIWKIGDERAHKTAHFTYISCCDMIIPQILSCREICRNLNMEPQTSFYPTKNH